jgi:hypothetical protein
MGCISSTPDDMVGRRRARPSWAAFQAGDVRLPRLDRLWTACGSQTKASGSAGKIALPPPRKTRPRGDWHDPLRTPSVEVPGWKPCQVTTTHGYGFRRGCGDRHERRSRGGTIHAWSPRALLYVRGRDTEGLSHPVCTGTEARTTTSASSRKVTDWETSITLSSAERV